MRLFIYFILGAIALIMFKAFFLDDYLAQRESADTNVSSVETVEEKPAPAIQQEKVVKPDNNVSEIKKKKTTQSHEHMPLDQLGDSIADKIHL